MQRSGDVASIGARQRRARDELRRALLGGALIGLVVGCAGGEDKATSGFTGFASNPTATNPTGQSGGETGDESSGGGTSDAGSSTNPVEQTTSGATTEDPTTAPVTTGPEQTTAPQTTGPQTTGPDTTSTTEPDTTTTTTTGPDTTSTTDPPPPPPKDPQPADGLYADCKAKDCNANLTDGCFELQDANMVKIDGFCTLLCGSDADCLPKPNAPAVNKCVDIGGGQKVCMLSCNGVIDCPTGMSCESVNLNGQSAKFCW